MANLSFLDDGLDQFLVVFGCVEPSEDLQHIVHFFLLSGSSPIESDLFLQVEQPTPNHKLFPPDPLIKLFVIDVDKPEFHGLLLFSVLIGEFHLRKEELGIVVVFDLEISTFWHIAHNLCGAAAIFGGMVNCQGSMVHRYGCSIAG